MIVPSWFGMEPSDIRSAINQLLTRSGGKRSGDHFTLDGAAHTEQFLGETLNEVRFVS